MKNIFLMSFTLFVLSAFVLFMAHLPDASKPDKIGLTIGAIFLAISTAGFNLLIVLKIAGKEFRRNIGLDEDPVPKKEIMEGKKND